MRALYFRICIPDVALPSVEFLGGFLSSDSHHNGVVVVVQHNVGEDRIALRRRQRIRIRFCVCAGATPKNPFSALMAYSLPSAPWCIHAISSPTHRLCSLLFYKFRAE
jgi:hypothetical protein